MKRISRFVLTGCLLFVATTAHAQTPREQLNQMVQQLQKNPSDNALREKIIKLGARIRPALPDEAVRYTGRAMFIFNTAKREADYLDAAREYERAVASAPWRASYYADLCTIYEKAGKYAEAKRACDFALVGTTDSSQAIELKQRIAGLEIGVERNSVEAQAQRKQEEFAVFLKSIEGAVFQSDAEIGWIYKFRIEYGVLLKIATWIRDGSSESAIVFKPAGFETTYPPRVSRCGWDSCMVTITLSPDGKALTETTHLDASDLSSVRKRFPDYMNPKVMVYRRVN